MKKFVSFLLTLAMLLSLSVTAFADETSAGITVSVNSSGPAQDGLFEIKLENPTFQITTPGVVEGRTLSWTGGDDLVEFEQKNIINSNDTMVFQLIGKIKDNGSTKVTFTTSDEKSTTIDLKVNLPTVTFLDEDDTVLYKSIVVGNKVASMPENPTKEGKNFIGWWYSYEKKLSGKFITKEGWLNETTPTDSGKLNTVHAKWEDAPNATPVATVGNDSYDTVEDAAVAVADDTEITINEATTIGNITVEAGSTVTAKTETAAAATNNAATVTPKTLTISKDGEETKTVKAYVVSGGTGDEAKSTVVTNVAKDSSVVNETNSGDVSDYVNVAQVLANAATGSKKDGEAATFDASSITGMELSLITKNTNNAGTVTNQTLQAAIDDVNVTVFDVYPLAKVTTKTTVEGTTSTETYEYDASNDLATGATFTFRLPVGNGSDAGKTAKLTHYHQEANGEWSTETIYGIVDQYGLVTITLDRFSYITVDSLNATDFATLVANAEAGSTITLDADVALTNTVEINKNLTINLNGHSITATDARALWVKSGDVTITGNGTVSAGTANSTFGNSSSVIRVGDSAANTNKAMLTIGENVTVSSPYCYGITAFGNNDTDNDKTTADIELVVNGTVSVSGVQAAVSGNGTNTLSATTMTINGSVSSTNDYAIYHPGKGALTVNGTVSGEGGIEIKSGTLTVGENASITATATTQSHSTNNNGTSTSGYAIAAVGNSAYVGDPAVTINGGTISGTAITLAENNSVKYGSITANSASIAVPEGYTWVSGSNGYELALVNEAFGEVYNYAGLFGNTYEMTIRFKYGDVVAANMSDYTVQLWLENGDGAGVDRLLSSSSASEYQASNVTTYKMGNVFTSGGNTFRDFTVKLFAQYLDSKIIVKLVRNSDSAVLPIATFGYRTIRTSTVATDGWGYSLKEFIDFRADYFNDASCGNNAAAGTAYSNLSSAISSISSATKAASAYAN